MKKIYGYIRVSTKKQGDGVSLEVQKSDIIRFARLKNLQITRWFEEKKSASKGFRPMFSEMIELLYAQEAEGFIAHKIDRMMRNRHDWAIINELMDEGCEVLSADGTQLDDVNGRFMGDIQAAVATRYSSNLAQEAKKGLYGRLKQGIYPFAAPIGYLDTGAGKSKTIDPVKSPLIRELFNLYTKKGLTIRELVKHMKKSGLTNIRGNTLSKNSISKILRNKFYIGLMSVRNHDYKGLHKPIIKVAQFRRAEAILNGRFNITGQRHNFLFRKLLKCKFCNCRLIGERQKGNIYYRCHTKNCLTKGIRELSIQDYIKDFLSSMKLYDSDVKKLSISLENINEEWISHKKQLNNSLSIRIGTLEKKLSRITELLIDGTFDKNDFIFEKQKILVDKQELIEEKNRINNKKDAIIRNIKNFLELVKTPYLLYETANFEEKRNLLQIITSNIYVEGKKLVFTTVSPFAELLNRQKLTFGGLNKTQPRNSIHEITYSDNSSPKATSKLGKTNCELLLNQILNGEIILPSLFDIKKLYELPKNDTSPK